METKNYFQHDYRSRLDSKLLEVRMKHGMAGFGIYWCLVEMLHEGNGVIKMKPEVIAFELQVSVEIIKDIINICFETDGDVVEAVTILLKTPPTIGAPLAKERTPEQKQFDEMRKQIVEYQSNDDGEALTQVSIQHMGWLPVYYPSYDESCEYRPPWCDVGKYQIQRCNAPTSSSVGMFCFNNTDGSVNVLLASESAPCMRRLIEKDPLTC